MPKNIHLNRPQWVKTNDRRIMQFSQSGSPGTLRCTEMGLICTNKQTRSYLSWDHASRDATRVYSSTVLLSSYWVLVPQPSSNSTCVLVPMQLHTCQVSCLRIRLQRCRVNDILLTQRTNIFLQTPVKMQPFIWRSTLLDMSAEPCVHTYTDGHADRLQTRLLFATRNWRWTYFISLWKLDCHLHLFVYSSRELL